MKINQKYVRERISNYVVNHGGDTLGEVAHVSGVPDFFGLVRLYFAVLYLTGDKDAGRVLQALIWFDGLGTTRVT